jgi:hypothetical protein
VSESAYCHSQPDDICAALARLTVEDQQRATRVTDEEAASIELTDAERAMIPWRIPDRTGGGQSQGTRCAILGSASRGKRQKPMDMIAKSRKRILWFITNIISPPPEVSRGCAGEIITSCAHTIAGQILPRSGIESSHLG